jgi:hypothetical protein
MASGSASGRRPYRTRAGWAGALLFVAALLAGCGPARHSLGQLAAHQEAYDGQEVTTSGTVRSFEEPSGTYYVLEDAFDDRVELTPADRVADLVGKTVTVTGRFSVDPAQGRVIAVDSVEASAS